MRMHWGAGGKPVMKLRLAVELDQREYRREHDFSKSSKIRIVLRQICLESWILQRADGTQL